jgi:hypothetical protein
LLVVSFITSLQLNLWTTLTKQNTVESRPIILHAQNKTAVKASVLLTGIDWLLVTKQETGRFIPAQITAKVNYELLSQYHYN